MTDNEMCAEMRRHTAELIALDTARDLRRALPASWRVWVEGTTVHVVDASGRVRR